MNRAQAEALVAELGQRLGIKGLSLDARGSCTVAIDDGMVTCFGIIDMGRGRPMSSNAAVAYSSSAAGFCQSAATARSGARAGEGTGSPTECKTALSP
jgi:hypothetical protein